MSLLIHTLRAAAAGQGGALFIVGEAGIGKSRLAREAAAEARRCGMRVLLGRAVQGESPAPFRPLAEALLSHLRTTGLPEVPELVPFRPILGRLVPEWRQTERAMDHSIVGLGEGVLRLLRVLASDRGCLLILEDLHWADPETLAILEYLADNVHAESVLCLATLRSEEGSLAVDLAHSLRARRAASVLELPRLSDVDVNRMVHSCLRAAQAPTEVTDFLRAHSEGVPFLVEELLAAALEAGVLAPEQGRWTLRGPLAPSVPPTFAATVRRRLSALGDTGRRAISAGAVLGKHFDWTLLAPMAGSDEAGVLDALHRAVQLQLVAAEGQTGFQFRHALTRDAILGELLPPEREELSRRALAVLRARHPDLPGGWCELAAELAEMAGDREQAATLLLEAGRRALGRGALATAEAALDRARRFDVADPLLQTDVLEALAEVLSLAGKTDRAFEMGEALLASLEALSAPSGRRARARLLLARAAITASRWEPARDHLAFARRLGLESGDEALLPPIDALAAQVALGEGQPDWAVALARAALAGAEWGGLPEVACEALEVIGRCARLRDLDQAEAAFERSRRIAEEHGLPLWRIRALHELGTIDLLSAAPVDRLTQARELAMQGGALATAAVVDLQIGASLLSRFALDGAMEALERSAELARRFHLDPVLGMDLVLQAGVHALRGRQSEMEAFLADALRVAGEHPDVAASVWGERGTLSLLQENRKRAIRELDTAMEIVERSATTSPHPFRGLWALLRALEGDDAACTTVEASGVTVQRVNRGFLSYANALLLGRAGREPEAEAAFARGDAQFAPLPLYHQLARRLAAEGAIECGWGDPVAWLREAAIFFEEQGHLRVVSACRSLLRRAGAVVPRRGRGEAAVPAELRVLGVTSREMDVLLLLAEGLSNSEIGARLYISPRTVERHVESLMAKTGIENRRKLIAFAARVGTIGRPA